MDGVCVCVRRCASTRRRATTAGPYQAFSGQCARKKGRRSVCISNCALPRQATINLRLVLFGFYLLRPSERRTIGYTTASLRPLAWRRARQGCVSTSPRRQRRGGEGGGVDGFTRALVSFPRPSSSTSFCLNQQANLAGLSSKSRRRLASRGSEAETRTGVLTRSSGTPVAARGGASRTPYPPNHITGLPSRFWARAPVLPVGTRTRRREEA